jgi:phenylalanyl-tRNA synthetase beta subunit
LEFRDPEKSLSDEEVNLEIDKIYKKLKSSSLDK